MSESRPPQHQEHQPGREAEMSPRPRSDRPEHRGTGRLDGKTVVITGGDSGIGRAVALSVAKEGANAAIVYLNEHEDAQETQRLVAERGRDSVTIAGDAGDDGFCRDAIRQTLERFGSVDYLVNNAGEQHPQTDFTKISREQLERTFRTNIFSFFYMTQAALPRLHEGSAIVNMASVNAYKGNPELIDYTATKGAIVALTRALALNLADRKIRVNAVAPGPIWTPLIPASFPPDEVAKFGQDVPMKRPGEPDEVAAAVLFLLSDAASYITGQTLHPNGGTIVNG